MIRRSLVMFSLCLSIVALDPECTTPTGSAQEQHPTGTLDFSVRSLPLVGFEDTVDAVTKASNTLDTLRLWVGPIAPPDSLDSIYVDWGDSTAPKSIHGSQYTAGSDTIRLTHWYVGDQLDSVRRRCTTSAFAVSLKGARKDTSFTVKVIRATEH